MHGAHNTCRNACILSAKNAHALVHGRLCTVQKLLCHGSCCELILSVAQASCRLSFLATCPPAVSTKPVARRCSLKKSVQIHASSRRGHRCGVAQASFDHPCWCRPYPLCLWVALEACPRSPPITEIYLHHFFRGLSKQRSTTQWVTSSMTCLSPHHEGREFLQAPT